MKLELEILDLKFELNEKEDMIDDLCQQRDENSKDMYKMRLMLAAAWNIQLATDEEKVKEVLRLMCDEERKSGAAKDTNSSRHIIEPMEVRNSNLKNGTANATDSGIDVSSLEKLIDERVAATLDKKLKEQPINHPVAEKVSDEKVINIMYSSKTEITEPGAQRGIIDQRDLNIIIHGLPESEGEATSHTAAEIFDTVEFKNEPTTSAIRLGSKAPEKTRPIRITLSSCRKKEELMSNLWKLKRGPDKFHKISVTDDYTKDEREEIKRWVTEAKKRTEEENGFVWKVRGSPRSQI